MQIFYLQVELTYKFGFYIHPRQTEAVSCSFESMLIRNMFQVFLLQEIVL